MEISELKEYIYENDKVELILNELGCKSIKYHDGTNKYWSCAFPDGDNTSGLTVYNNEYLNIVSYTRNIQNPFGTPSIIDVVCFLKDFYISNAIKWVCDLCGLNYYQSPQDNLPASVQWTKMIINMKNESNNTLDEEILKPINKNILNYYKPYVNDVFKNDGISYSIQKEFEIGYDLYSHRYTIPIYDELGVCVGVKGRYYKKEVPYDEDKYTYLESCSKTKILYGLYKTYPYIIKERRVIVVESEKSVLKAWSDGIFNIVAISGHCLSKVQVNKLTSLGVDEIILCYDEDVFRNEKTNKISKEEYMEEINKFIPQQKVSVMVDMDGKILNKKESPIDDINKFNIMYKSRILLR